jgi:hypothetical protein
MKSKSYISSEREREREREGVAEQFIFIYSTLPQESRLKAY